MPWSSCRHLLTFFCFTPLYSHMIPLVHSLRTLPSSPLPCKTDASYFMPGIGPADWAPHYCRIPLLTRSNAVQFVLGRPVLLLTCFGAVLGLPAPRGPLQFVTEFLAVVAPAMNHTFSVTASPAICFCRAGTATKYAAFKSLICLWNLPVNRDMTDTPDPTKQTRKS